MQKRGYATSKTGHLYGTKGHMPWLLWKQPNDKAEAYPLANRFIWYIVFIKSWTIPINHRYFVGMLFNGT